MQTQPTKISKMLVRTSVATTGDGPGTGLVYDVVERDRAYQTFVVSNGNVQGDRKLPNPVKYVKRITETTGASFRQRQLAHGIWPGSNPTRYYQNMVTTWRDGPASTPALGTYDSVILANNWLWPDLGPTRDRAMEKIYDQLRNGPNLIVDLVESGQTLRMLRAVTNLRTLMRDFLNHLVFPRNLRGRMTSGQARLDYVTGKWLEYRYGWRPLVGTIYDSFETLAQTRQMDEFWVKARSGRRDERRVDRSNLNLSETDLNTYLGVSHQGSGKRWDFYTCSTSVWSEVALLMRPKVTPSLSEWTSLNPALIAWELLPFSFVVDWAVNIGSYLEQMENQFLFAQYFVKGYRTDTTRVSIQKVLAVEAEAKRVALFNSNFIRDYHSFHAEMLTEWTKERTVLSTIPGPEGIRVQLKMNSKRFLDAASLLHMTVGKWSRRSLGTSLPQRPPRIGGGFTS